MATQQVQTTLIDNFEDASRSSKWQFGNGPEFPGAAGYFKRSDIESHSGKYSGALSFNFTGGGNYVIAGIDLPKDKLITGVRLWIKKNTGNKLTIRCTDSEGQTFQKTFRYPYHGWQEVSVSLDGWTGGWGGKGDGIFRGSPSYFGLIVENDAQPVGTVYFDDVSLLTGRADERAPASTIYTAASFGQNEGWYLTSDGNAGASSWNKPTLSYDFSKGAKTIGLATDWSLMGKPEKLLLNVQSDGSGRDVRVRIGSHFQTFEKIIGKLDKVGPQTLEADMVGMTGWRHFGGEDDGLPLFPLRIIGIALTDQGTTPTGRVDIFDIKVHTKIASDQSVILVPTGHVSKGNAVFSCEVRNLLPTEAKGSLQWSFTDWTGRQISSDSKPFVISQGASINHTASVKLEGRPYLECAFRFRTAEAVYGPIAASAVEKLRDAGDASLQPESPWGMGVYLYRYSGDAAGLSRMRKAAEMARAAGVKWSREEFQWHRIEPEKGKFDWSFYDKLVDTAQNNGISVYGIIAYWSWWTKPYTKEGVEDYARYCTALVTRYKDKIKHWEVWNEPNIFFWSGPKELYNDLLKAAYKAIKQADPGAYVLGCSTAGIDRGFIERVIASGAKFDILTVHPYRGQLDDDAFMQELRDVSKLAAAVDGKKMPVWITEMGWPTQLYGGVSEPEQAALLARCYLSAAASGIDTNICWYDFREDGENPFYNEHHFGVVRSTTLEPKPAYRALATVCRTLAGLRVRRKLDLGPNIHAYLFDGKTRQAAVLWSPGKDSLISIKLDGQDIRIIDLMGSPTATVSLGGQSWLRLRANCPVFITGRKVMASQGTKKITVEAPQAAHGGEIVRIAWKRDKGLKSAEVTLDAPEGWTVSRAASDGTSFDIAVPTDARQGHYNLTLVLRLGTKEMPVSVNLEVIPALLGV